MSFYKKKSPYETISDDILKKSDETPSAQEEQERRRALCDLFFHSLHTPDMDRYRATIASRIADHQREIASQYNTNIFMRFFNQAFHHQPNQANTIVQNSYSKTLEEIGYHEEIPSNYVCPLSLDIMNDPVYAPGFSYAFEKAWIEESLKIKQENPFTRAPLTVEELIPAPDLKGEIEAFVNSKVDEHRQHGLR